MKLTALLFGLFLVLATSASAQNQAIQNIINAVSIDTLVKYANDITGENPVTINGVQQTIDFRHSNAPGNAICFDYLVQKFLGYGLAVDSQLFAGGGENVMAWQPGTVYPDQYFILCAHYDAIGGDAADDDGSGTVAVLEAARILSQLEFEYSIMYAIWDREEQGLQGSGAFASTAGAGSDLLLGVINMDAIAWDGNGDNLARVHTEPLDESEAMADSVVALNTRYNIGLNMVINNPGATYSDHASFWNNGFPAILIIEDFDNDGNPNYHTATDVVDSLHLDYFEKLVKLSFATLAAHAIVVDTVPPVGFGTSRNAGNSAQFRPNPVKGSTTLEIMLDQPAFITIEILDLAGKQLFEHETGLQLGQFRMPLPVADFGAGVYFGIATTRSSTGQATRHVQKLVILD